MKAITFLGTNEYKPTTYSYQGKTCPTLLFPIAMQHFFQPEEMLVFVTEKAMAKWGATLHTALNSQVKLKFVDIPDGHSEDDLWAIFAQMTTHLQPNDKVIFDVTHSFRTLPMLTFIAASFLRTALEVTICGIYYGAWEARIPLPPADASPSSAPTDLSPVFDLTPFLELLSWTSGTETFLQTGDSRNLAKLLNQRKDALKRKATAVSPAFRHLEDLANSLHGVSQAAALTRPQETLQCASDLIQAVGRVKADVSEASPAFSVLFDKLSAAYQPLAAGGNANGREKLKAQTRLFKWYFERELYVQAVTHAREWIVSVTCYALNLQINDGVHRDGVCDGLNALIQSGNASKGSKPGNYDAQIQNLHCADALKSAWEDTKDCRNQIAHCGFPSHKDRQIKPTPAEQLQAMVNKIPDRIQALSNAILGE